MSDFSISQVTARWILDSRGYPTVEAQVTLRSGVSAMAAVPSGASTGSYEALELRDGGTAFFGTGVSTAVSNVNTVIAEALQGADVRKQQEIDRVLLELDGTLEKKNLGANALLAVSLACLKAAAVAQGQQLFEYVTQTMIELSGEPVEVKPFVLPTFNVLNGGAHTDWQSTNIQEFMVVPVGANSTQQAVQWGSEIYHTLKEVLKKNNLSTLLGDEGGFAPHIPDQQALEFILESVTQSGYKLGEQVKIALDVAASEWFNEETKQYDLPMSKETLSSAQLIERWKQWAVDYPIFSIEDGLDEDDWQNWSILTTELAQKGILTVGDDLLVTNPARITQAISLKACNAIIMKINQIGTITEALTAIHLSKQAGFEVIVSHRSGETEDTSIADIAVGTGCALLKSGSLARTERTAKYNQLMRIEDYRRLNQ